jgi:signal peptidase II
MTRIPRLAVLAYALAATVIALDQAVKYWIVRVFDLPHRSPQDVIGPFRLNWECNNGVSFGILNIDADWTRWVLAAFALAVAGGLALWARRLDKTLLAFAVGLIMGGAVGNAIDRLHSPGCVADFLDFSQLHFFPWIFNVADSAITIGSVLLIWDLFLAPRKRAPG